ncbi:GNAT family N-acetyltransferase [Clostridium arbusti]|uniref:GNAT family N-acetyltransferase n=1 Tax=Clostridium arbusti TaxID=1137848 RepID=UPI000288A57C|nr:GNAT family protein [Clostridium arbusti]
MTKNLFKEFPEIKTDKIILRELNFNDIRDMFEIFSNEEVMRYYDVLPHKNIEDTERLFFTYANDYKDHKSIRWGIINIENNKLIGTCGFYNFDYKSTRAEIGYELNKAYWKQGFMHKALNEIIKLGFENSHLKRIEAIVHNENKSSKMILERLAFKHEGCLRKRFYFNGEFRDENYFGLLKDEWQ